MKNIVLTLFILLAVSAAGSAATAAEELSLEQAIHFGIQTDDWLRSSELRESAYRDEATSHQALPDPILSLGLANMPTDSWDFDQENMTQLKVGLTQQFPRGDTRRVKARKSQLMADVNPDERRERKAQLTRKISLLWLDGFFAMKTILLIEAERYLFEQLVDVATARYQTALGGSRQQDVVRAQLELTKLEDRLTRLHLQYEMNRELLAEWLPNTSKKLTLTENLPPASKFMSLSLEAIQHSISQHPQLRITDRRIDIQAAEIDLARQKYKPGWAINASYGYREDSPIGDDRSDFFSVGVSFDLPLFTENRQDKTVSAASYRKQALSIDHSLQRRKLLSNALKTQAQLERLEERSRIYHEKLLKQAHEQAEASLSAYTNDDGDFADVMRAFIVKLNSKIEALEIDIERRKALATMNYFLAGNTAHQGEAKDDS